MCYTYYNSVTLSHDPGQLGRRKDHRLLKLEISKTSVAVSEETYVVFIISFFFCLLIVHY